MEVVLFSEMKDIKYNANCLMFQMFLAGIVGINLR